jgi:outer membrane autotransporter protein
MNTERTTVLRTIPLRRQRAKKSRTAFRRRILCTGIAAALVCAAAPAFAASATWNANPITNDWNMGTNWTPATVPNGAADTATFGLSNQTFITTSAETEVNGITFNPLASPFTIRPEAAFLLTISGTGITNSSLIPQNFVTWNIATIFGRIRFTNSATAGSMVIFTNNAANIFNFNSGGSTSFFNNSNAGSGTFINLGSSFSGGGGGFTQFTESSSAGSGNFTNNGGTVSGAFGGHTFFFGSTTAANGTFTSNGGTASGALGGVTAFFDNSTAGSATLTANGGAVGGASGGFIQFWNASTAGNATFTTNGGTGVGADGGTVQFSNTSTAGTGTFVNNAATSGGGSGITHFYDTSTAGNGSFTNNNGAGPGGETAFHDSSSAGGGTFVNKGATVNGGGGGITFFGDTSNAGTSHFTNFGGSGSLANGGQTYFTESSSAGSADFTNHGGTVSGAFGGATIFSATATAASGTFTIDGGAVGGANAGGLQFFGSSTAGNATVTTNGGTGVGADGGTVQFSATSTAGSGTFVNNAATSGGASGMTNFNGTSTAGNATFTNNNGAGPGGETAFHDSSSAGGGTFVNKGATVNGGGGGSTFFGDTANAGTSHFTNFGGSASSANGGQTYFTGSSSAGSADFTNHGGTVRGAFGGATVFSGTATAGSATFTINGGTVSGAKPGGLQFYGSSTAGDATLIANGGLSGGAGGSITFNGDSTGGTATVKVFDNGNVDISGHNAPGLTIGSLEGNGNAFLGTRALTVGSNNLSTTFSGVMQDGGNFGGTGGSLTKIGTGTFALTGANTYTGDTNINAGTLFVDGSLASANVFVQAAGTLGGHGTLFGNVINHGTVSPGHSPGTLGIAGNFTQFADGVLRIEIAGTQPGQFDVLAVGGKANLNGTLQVVNAGGTVKVGDTLKILTAVAGVSGVFTAVSPYAGGPLIGMNVIYETNDVLLAFTQNSFAALSGTLSFTPNQLAVAQALDSVTAKLGGKTGVINEFDFLDNQPLDMLAGNLDKLSPDELTSIFNIAVSLANTQAAHIQNRTAEIRSEADSDGGSAAGGVSGGGGGAPGPVGKRTKEIPMANDERWGMWFTGSGEFTHVGSTTNAAGFNLDSGGVTAGVDYRFTDHFAAGISLGYMNTTASLSNGGKIDADGGRVGAYATYFDRGFYVDAAVSGGFNSYNTRRTTPNNTVAIGRPDGAEINVLLATGYDWKWKGLTLGPTASFQYTNVQLDGFTETGGFAPLSVAGQNAESLRTALGFHVTFDKKVGRAIVRPELRAAWQHEFGDTSYSLTSSFATLGGSAFTVAGPATGRDSLLVGAGFSVLWNDRFSTYAFYDGELLRTNYSSHNISLGFRYRF